MKVVHIGLIKTATTFIQQVIIPELCSQRQDIDCNPRWVKKSCAKHHKFGLNKDELSALKEYIDGQSKIIISIEDLLHPDPAHWEASAEKNKELFGEDAVIVITVRDPVDWYTSVYNQKVKTGFRRRPEEFFINDGQYDSIKGALNKGFDYLNVDRFNLEELYHIYKKKFDCVHVIPIQEIKKLKFISEPFALSQLEVDGITRRMQMSPKLNSSLTRGQIKKIFILERIFNKFGLKTCKHDETLLSIRERFDRDSADRMAKNITYATEHKPSRPKILNYVFFALKHPFFAMHRILEKLGVGFFSTKEYHLPPGLYLNDKLIDMNRAYIEKLLR